MPWLRVEIDGGKVQHIYPEDEVHAEDMSCDCFPVVERFDTGNVLVIHNAFDCREYHEPGGPKPQ